MNPMYAKILKNRTFSKENRWKKTPLKVDKFI